MRTTRVKVLDYLNIKWIKPYIKYIVGALIIILIALLILTATPEPQLMASAEVSIVRDNGQLRVGILSDKYITTGLEKEIAKRIENRIFPDDTDGDSLKFVNSYSRILGYKLDDGSVDIIIALSEKDANTGAYAYSSAYFTDDIVVIAKSGVSLDEFSENTVVGCIQNSSAKTKLNAYAKERKITLSIHDFASYEDMLKALEKGTIPYAVLERSIFTSFAKDNDSLAVTPLVIGKIEYACACSIDSPALASIASIVIDEMKDSGELNELINKYIEN